jgi:peptidoglycan/LPS O-acetylase OafA/YrhL
MSVFFLAGVVIASVRARREAASALALIWTVVMLLPTILAEDTPHFLRAVGVLLIAVILPALGLEQFSKINSQLPTVRGRILKIVFFEQQPAKEGPQYR